MAPPHRAYTKPEVSVLIVCGIYAAVSAAYILMSAASLLGPAWPPMFLWLSGLSAVLSIGVLVWWLLRARPVAAFATAGILAAVAAGHLWAAYAASAAV